MWDWKTEDDAVKHFLFDDFTRLRGRRDCLQWHRLCPLTTRSPPPTGGRTGGTTVADGDRTGCLGCACVCDNVSDPLDHFPHMRFMT